MKQHEDEVTVTLPKVTYQTLAIKDLQVKETFETTKNGVAQRRKQVKQIFINDQETKPSNRFWESLCSKFGFGPSVFRYFSHKEVFDRINEVSPNNKIRVAIQNTASSDQDVEGYKPILLGISNPEKPILDIYAVSDVLSRLVTNNVDYREGVMVSRHEPRNNHTFKIGPDDHETMLALETPIDGYGKPSIFLSLLRTVCSNGAVAYTKAFRSHVNLGTDSGGSATLFRIMDAYNNEDGFVALKQRMEAAQNSPASMLEVMRLSKFLWTLNNEDFKPNYLRKKYGGGRVEKDVLRNDLIKVLYQKSGDLRAIYGVAQLDSISRKRMRQLPTEAKVYDLLNFSTELATHCLRPTAARKMNGYFGDMISQEYDIETAGNHFGEFQDVMLGDTKPERDEVRV